MPNPLETLRYLPLAEDAPLPGERARSGDSGTWEAADKLLQVGDLAKATGKTVRAIHLYEEVGLLRPHARSKGRYRLYDHQALTRIRWIGKLHDLGLSLSQIQQMVKAWEASPSAPDAMALIRGIYQQKLEETRAQLQRLAGLERELAASVAYLDTCETCDPAELVGACSKCNLHGHGTEPDLIAGIHNGQCQSHAASLRGGEAREGGTSPDASRS
jgi:DNA-binding transcriptional MerR regulator